MYKEKLKAFVCVPRPIVPKVDTKMNSARPFLCVCLALFYEFWYYPVLCSAGCFLQAACVWDPPGSDACRFVCCDWWQVLRCLWNPSFVDI